jgi:hypothetical protein
VNVVPYIVLGVLVVIVIAMQIWIARSTSKVSGDRSGTVLFLRILNIVLLVGALLLVVYALISGR